MNLRSARSVSPGNMRRGITSTVWVWGSALAPTTSTTLVVEDADLSAASFRNINLMTPVGDHFFDNVRGHLAQALAVARSAQGGRYPVGTILQLVPQEAMVKRAPAGASATINRSRASGAGRNRGRPVRARNAPEFPTGRPRAARR
jgi:hypothetical protein